MANKQDVIKVRGRGVDHHPGARFTVELENGHKIDAHISGKMRKHYIKLLLGDSVEVELSPYDLEKGRITYRYKDE